MTGYGSGGWGDVPWGGPADEFDLLTADAISPTVVDLVFTAEVLFDSVATDPATYSIDNGLTVVSAVPGPYPNVVRLTTSQQVAGQFYTVTVLQTLQDVTERLLNLNVASFIGVGETVTAYVVSSGQARSFCDGKAINLSWTLPSGAQHVKIVRRTGAWPYDLTDTHDVVYDGPAISSFFDTGIVVPTSLLTAPAAIGATSVNVASGTGYVNGQKVKLETLLGERRSQVVTLTGVAGSTLTFAGQPLTVALSAGDRASIDSPLLGQTYYYYLVLVSTSVSPTTYDISDASRLMALSIDVYDGKDFFTNIVPSIYRERDRASVAEGGGGGFLDKWFTVMGCWLNLMRGQANAAKMIADPDKAPYHVLGDQNRSLGIEPEGEAYDFDIVRRPLTSLTYVYKRKGSCPGIVEAVRMFTKWDAVCAEFGFNRCAQGVGLLRTYDGTSAMDYGQSSSTITVSIVDTDGTAELVDTSKTWDAELWEDGTLRGWIGDIACIENNDGDTLTLKPPAVLTTLDGSAAADSTSLPLTSTAGLAVGMDIQVMKSNAAEIVTIFSITPGVSVELCNTLDNSYVAGDKISIQKSIIRSRYKGRGSLHVGQVMTDFHGLWTAHQWVGYKVRDAGGTVHNILDNTGNTLTVDGAAPADGAYTIAKDFTGSTPHYRYQALSGQHSSLLEPTLDLQLKGTVFNPYNPMYNGTGAAMLAGIYGPADIGVFVQTDVTLISGRAVGATGVTFTLDPSQPAPAVNALAGMYLNPNQNQVAMFRIVSNTATTLTLEENVSSLVVGGQAYYVMTPRDKTRFQRLNERLKNEFTDTDTTPRILFV